MKAQFVTLDPEDYILVDDGEGPVLITIPVRTVAKMRQVLGEGSTIFLRLDLVPR